MGRALKYLLFLLGGIVALVVVATVSFLLLFDANDFRDRIAEETRRATGRELVIEGDLDVTLFPWLAVSVGSTRLGNAPGFGDEPFASFEAARLSVRLLPLLLRREISVGTAELDALRLNLAVAANGRSNWDDLLEAGEAAPEGDEAAASGGVFDIASIEVNDAALYYRDAQTGDRYELTKVNMRSGRVAPGDPIPLSGELAFAAEPAGLSGTVELETVALFDTDAAKVVLDDLSVDSVIEGLTDAPATIELRAPAIVAETGKQVLSAGSIEASVFGVDIEAQVEPFSYAGTPEPVATVTVDRFSLKSLMQRLGAEVPPTADPGALERLALSARAAVSEQTIALTDVRMELDDTTLTGRLTLPRTESGMMRFDFVADTINLSRYMAPADESAAASGDEVPVEIPVELIRALNAAGTLKLEEGFLGDLRFTNVNLGLDSRGGRLRLHPVTAELFEGSYSGDVRVDASGELPAVSVNEQVTGVRLGALVAAMFEQENVTGTIEGSFVLAGRGADLDAIRRDLDGSIELELDDGALEGVDVWYELRRARALFRKEEPPAVQRPVRTEFSNIRAAGPVTDGVFDNNELSAELPFMRLTGKGQVDFAAATMDYRLDARVLDKPELRQAATEAELADLTQVVIPLRISGPLTGPRVAPDLEGLVRARARQAVEEKKEELKGRVLDELLGGRDRQQAPAEPAQEESTGDGTGDAGSGPAPEPEAEPEEEKNLEEQLKETVLKKIFEG